MKDRPPPLPTHTHHPPYYINPLSQVDGIDRFREVTGLPIAPYFSASKILWLLENVPGLRGAALAGEAVFGTVDTWLIYKLTGAVLVFYFCFGLGLRGCCWGV